MKVVLTLLAIAIASSVTGAFAQDTNTSAKASEVANAYPLGGGWDHNDAKISVVRAKLLGSKSTERYPLGGGWDANNVRVSVTKSKLLD